MSDLFQWTSKGSDAIQWLTHIDTTRPDLSAEKKQAIYNGLVRLHDQERQEAPLYLRALTGIGAIIAGFLIAYLLYLFGLFNSQPISLSMNGVGLMVAAMLLYRLGITKTGLGQDFSLQLALTLLQAGKVALVAGLVQYFEPLLNVGWIWPIVAALGFVGILSFLLFPSSLERFLAAMAFLVALWVAMVSDGPDTSGVMSFTSLILLHLLALAAFLRWSAWRRHLTSLYDALLVSLCIGVGIVATFVDWATVVLPNGQSPDVGVHFDAFFYTSPTQILLTMALIALILWAGRNQWTRSRTIWFDHPLLIAVIGVLILGGLSDPGILLALGLLVLGYATHRPAHSILGFLFALGFGIRFYYALNLSLLEKSAILVASGLLLLAAAGYIHWRGWNTKPESHPGLRQIPEGHQGGAPDA